MNNDTNHVLRQTQGRTGCYVGLIEDGTKAKLNRAVNRLVANAFVPKPDNEFHRETFDTPIHLDGDRNNNRADNLMWRPLWFAMEYHTQFKNVGKLYMDAVIDMNSQQYYATCWDAAVSNGILAKMVWNSAHTEEVVWPTGQHFVLNSSVPITSSSQHGL